MKTNASIVYEGFAFGSKVWVVNLANNTVVSGAVVGVKLKNCGYWNAEGAYTVNKAECYDIATDDSESGILYSVYPNEIWPTENEALTRLLYVINEDLQNQMEALNDLQQVKARIQVRLEKVH